MQTLQVCVLNVNFLYPLGIIGLGIFVGSGDGRKHGKLIVPEHLVVLGVERLKPLLALLCCLLVHVFLFVFSLSSVAVNHVCLKLGVKL